MEVLLGVLGVLLVVATALPVSKRQSWWVRGLDFPRLQIAAGLLLVGIAHAVLAEPGPWAYALWSAMAVALGAQLLRMARYTRLAQRQVHDSENPDPANGMRLLFANVLQDNRNAQGLLEIVREADPDLVLTLETDDWWAGALGDLARTHPHTVLQPMDNTYGMLLYSCLELVEPRVRFLIQNDVPSIHARVRLQSGREVELHCLHPRPPAPSESDSSAVRDAELLIVGRAIRKHPGPVVVMGDMNDVAWSHTTHLFQKISGLLDPRVGRGFFNTFNAKHWLVRFPLDHFFHSNDFKLVSFRRLPYFGSDHFPVFIHLSHEPQAQREQPEEHPDAADREEADEKVMAVRR